MKIRNILFIILLTGIHVLYAGSQNLAPNPPMGWNSYDSYRVYLYEEAANANLEAFAEKFAPYGYEFYVIDSGWFDERDLEAGTNIPKSKGFREIHMNEFGLLQPSESCFPNGLKPLIDRCHKLGLKFGLHMMRGITREAYKRNVKIKGTPYTAHDIADTTDVCHWSDLCYGVDMSKPGAQEFYNSILNQMAEWGVDFIKYDDIVPHPDEIQAVAKAVDQCGRPIVLSLSPGNNADPEFFDVYGLGDMVRVTRDIWDNAADIDICFSAWRKWQDQENLGFWLDMDMIPFGQLNLLNPRKPGEAEHTQAGLAGVRKGSSRWSLLNREEMYTFITMRAMAASPLMIGGDLPTMDEFSLRLLTNKEMIRCNQNGIMGSLKYDQNDIEIWQTPEKDSANGWIAVFNHSDKTQSIEVSPQMFDLRGEFKFYNVWDEYETSLPKSFVIRAHGVVFLRYDAQ